MNMEEEQEAGKNQTKSTTSGLKRYFSFVKVLKLAFKSSLSNYPCTYRLRPKKSKRILQPAEHASKPTWKVVFMCIRIFVVFVTTLQSHFYNHIKVNSSRSFRMVTS